MHAELLVYNEVLRTQSGQHVRERHGGLRLVKDLQMVHLKNPCWQCMQKVEFLEPALTIW